MKSRAGTIAMGFSLVFMAFAVWLHQRPSIVSAFARGTLTRARAAELLRGEPRFSRPVAINFAIGETMFAGKELNGTAALYRVLHRAGFTRSRVANKYGDLDVQLTPEAQQLLGAVGGEVQEGWWIRFPLGRRELIEITGITREGDAARVEFTYRVALNEVGRSLQSSMEKDTLLDRAFVVTGAGVDSFDEGQVQTSVAVMRLYDDGWRVVPD